MIAVAFETEKMSETEYQRLDYLTMNNIAYNRQTDLLES